MDVAKAMSLGGKIIHAERCDYHSYINLGLRCPVCGEPVYLRKGDYRQPHFAHFKGTNPRQVEECTLKASVYSNSTQACWNNLYQNRGQRLEIFQKHFLNITAKNNSEFYNQIKLVKDTYSPYRLEALTRACTQCFIEKKERLKKEYCTSLRENCNKVFKLQKQIGFEAIDYLCIKSSVYLLESLIHYSLHEFYHLKTYDICQKLVEFVVNTPWLELFSLVNGFDEFKNILYKDANTGISCNSYSQGKTDTDPKTSCFSHNVECRIRLNDIRKSNLLCWVEYRLLDGNISRNIWNTVGTINLQTSRKGNTFLGFNDAKSKPLAKLAQQYSSSNAPYWYDDLLLSITGLIGQSNIGALAPKSDSRWLNVEWQVTVLRCVLQQLPSTTVTIIQDRRCGTSKPHKSDKITWLV